MPFIDNEGVRMIKKKDMHITAIDIIIFIILPLIIVMLLYVNLITSLHSYMETLVANQAQLLERIASQRISSRMEELEAVTDYLRDGRVEESDMGAAVGRLLDNPTQINIGILRQDGTPVTGHPLRSSEYPAIQAAFHGKNTVRYRRGEGLLFTAPIYNGGNVKYALYEFFDEKAMFDQLTVNFFNDEGQIMLADSERNIIMPFEGDATEKDPYFSDESVELSFAKLNQDMQSASAAAVYRKGGGKEEFIFVVNMQQENLYLVGILPYNVVAEGVNGISNFVLLMFAVVIVLLTFGSFRVINANAKARESDALREAKQAAEEASRSKSNFLANMSHELRTPINAIMGFNEMILREAGDPSTRERALDVQSAAQILLGLINDVLDYSKIESGNLNIIDAEYNLTYLIRDLVLLSENRARAKSLDFEIVIEPSLPIGLYGDDNRIRQVLTNLLTNAVKYTPSGTVTLKITGERLDEDTERLHIEVLDTGTGIKPEDLAKLFVPYSRADEKRNRNVEGTGLGLSIVINLLRLMGSELQVESDYGEGSNFYFDLDQKIVDPEPVGDIQERLSNMVQDYKHKIGYIAPDAKLLMVDDNSMNRKIFAHLLEPTQMKVTTVSSGQKCLDIVTKEHFDIIFMDHLMPDMDGVETLRRLKELEGNLCVNSPVIALTANAFTGAEEKYKAMGFDDFLPKPIATEKLENLIQILLPPEYIKEVQLDEYDGEIPEPEDDKLPVIEGVNWDYALLHIKSHELLLDTLKDFYNGIDDDCHDIEALEKHTDTGEGLADYRIKVHSLKSTSGMVGVLSVSEIAKLLENAAREGDTEKINKVTPVLIEELIKVKAHLGAEFGTDEEKSFGDTALLAAELGILCDAMEEMDISKADGIMKQINEFSYAPEIQNELEMLAKQVALLNYEDASEIALKLKNSIERSFGD